MAIDYQLQSPPILRDFLLYHENVKMHSIKTVDEYFLDLRNFFRYLKIQRNPDLKLESFDLIDILDIDIEFLRSVTSSDILGYVTFLSRRKMSNNHSSARTQGLTSKTKARKLASIRSFFKYLTETVILLEVNPAQTIDNPKQKKTIPQYLTEDQCNRLLDAVSGTFATRDYCILLLFLSCGLRISELVGLNISDIQDDSIRVRGKGNKERILYLNEAALDAIDSYLLVRDDERIKKADKDALFISRNFQRLHVRSVQQMVDKTLIKAGLDAKTYSPHKLRHSAATMLLQNGVDVRTLQDVLGHENLNTTQIYTHVDNEGLRIAAAANPIGKRKKKQ